MVRRSLLVLLSLIFLSAILALAQDKADSAAQAKPAASDQKPAAPSEEEQAAALQKATQNPVANLISVPLQNNTNFNIGPFNRTQDVLNIQPVIPVHITKDWNLITRIIQPIVWQPYPNQNTGGEYGLGDMNPTFFLSPAKPGKVIWGVGPAFVIPTATSDITRQGKFSLGPSVVALVQPPHWTIGVITNNVWSVAGSGGRPPVNQFFLQYFVNYNMKKGYYITSGPIITANWRASSGNVWTLPFGGGVGRIMKLGFQPVNIAAEFYGNAVYPAGTSPWSMRLQIAFLFPKFTKEQAPALAQPTPVMALAVSGMNDVLNSQGYTQAAWWNRIPKAAWAFLVITAIGCNVLVGYGARRLQSITGLLFVMPLLVAISFLLIADIDSPRGGLIHVAPQNLAALYDSLHK